MTTDLTPREIAIHFVGSMCLELERERNPLTRTNICMNVVGLIAKLQQLHPATGAELYGAFLYHANAAIRATGGPSETLERVDADTISSVLKFHEIVQALPHIPDA